jgi:hypothetical protein
MTGQRRTGSRHSDGIDPAEHPMPQAGGDDVFYGVKTFSHEVRNASAVSFHSSR